MLASRLYDAEPPEVSPERIDDGLAIVRADKRLLFWIRPRTR